jgi:hypothetical protein
MSQRLLERSLIVLLLFTGAMTRVSATVVVPADLGDLVGEAQSVVYGRVLAVRSIRSDDRGTETLVTLEVAGYLKGQGGRQLVFRVPGGEIGRYRTIVVGAPAFREGDEVVCFLKGRAPEVPSLVGFSQGALRVYTDEVGVRRVMAPPLRQEQPEPVVRGEGYRRMVTLDQFAVQVRDVERMRIERERGKDPSQAPRKIWLEGR